MPRALATGERPALQSVTIALGIIDALADNRELGLSELARRVGIAKSTAHRTCSVLVGRGLLRRTPAGTYQLGLRFVEYGQLAVARSAVGDRALPMLVELRNALGETVQIGVPDGGDVVYVERVEGVHALRYIDGNPRRAPVHRSSAGKVLAAYIPEVLEARLRAGLPPSTGYTIVVPDVFRQELGNDLQARVRPQHRRDRARDVVARGTDPRPCRGSGGRRDLDGRADRPHRRLGRVAPCRDVDGRRPPAHGEPRVGRVPPVVAAPPLTATPRPANPPICLLQMSPRAI